MSQTTRQLDLYRRTRLLSPKSAERTQYQALILSREEPKPARLIPRSTKRKGIRHQEKAERDGPETTSVYAQPGVSLHRAADLKNARHGFGHGEVGADQNVRALNARFRQKCFG